MLFKRRDLIWPVRTAYPYVNFPTVARLHEQVFSIRLLEFRHVTYDGRLLVYSLASSTMTPATCIDSTMPERLRTQHTEKRAFTPQDRKKRSSGRTLAC